MYRLLLTVQPFMMPTSVALAVVLFGIAYVILSVKIQRTLSDPKKMRETQARIQALTTEMNEMVKNKQDVSEKQKELMPLMGDSMKIQMKSMFVILPAFYAVYYLLLPNVFGRFTGAAFNFIIPMTYTSLFFITILVVGLASSFAILAYDKRKAKSAVSANPSGAQ